MSNTIDKRIVEMRFDNDQFEKGAKETMSTLDRLKKALDLSGSKQSFEAIDKAANSIDLGSLVSGVEFLEKRFSAMGIVGMRVLENLTDTAMNFAKSGIGLVYDSIVNGGKRRAQNIENAHFQLQALLKDESKVQAVMNDAMKSVDGTAYTYDEAAKAASQFAATGIEAGEDMMRALNGITGVAAMTNSEYENISWIFTTVAGNGRLMGDQLLQLSSRGMNAAVTIADYFNKVNSGSVEASESVEAAIKSLSNGLTVTEGEIREWVSDGKISFEMFAESMNDAFGDAAGRANETLTGAFANMKSALARIGAGFYSPLIEQNGELVKAINSLRVIFNSIKSELIFDTEKSAIRGLTKEFGVAEDKVKTLFTTISDKGHVAREDFAQLRLLFSGTDFEDSAKVVTDYANAVADGSKRAEYSIKSAIDTAQKAKINDTIRGIVDGTIQANGVITSFVRNATNGIELTDDAIQGLLDDGTLSASMFDDMVKLTTEDIYKMADEGTLSLSMLETAISDTYDNEYELSKKVTDYIQDRIVDVKEWIDSLDIISLTKAGEQGFWGIVNALASVLALLRPIGDALTDIFHIPNEAEILDFATKITDKIKIFRSNLTGNNKLLENLKRTSKGFFAVIDIGVQFIEALGKALSPVISKIGDFAQEVLGITGDLGDWLVSLDDAIKENDLFTKSIERIKEFFKPLTDLINGGIDGIIGKMKELTGSIGTIDLSFISDFLNSDGRELPDLLGFVTDKLEKIAPIVSAIGKVVGDTFHNIKEGIARAISGKGFEDILDLFNGLMFSGGSFYAVKLIKQLANSMELLKAKFLGINADGSVGDGGLISMLLGKNIPAQIRGILTQTRGSLVAFQADLKADVLEKLAKAIAILAASLFVISMIDGKQLAQSLGAVTAMLFELMAAYKASEKFSAGEMTASFTKENGLQFGKKGMGSSLIQIAASVLIMAVALRSVAKLNIAEIGKGLLVLTVILGEMVGFIALLKKIKPENLRMPKGVGAAFMEVALSLVIIAAAFKIMEGISWDAIKKGGAVFGGAVGALTIAFGALSVLSGSATKAYGGIGASARSGGSIAAIGFAFMEVATSMVILAAAFKIMSTIKPEEIDQGVKAFSIVFLAMTVAMGALSHLSGSGFMATAKGISGGESQSIASIGFAFMELATAMVIVAAALKITSTIDTADLYHSAIVLSGIIVLMEILAGITSVRKIDTVSFAKSLFEASVGILAMALALKVLSTIDYGKLIASTIVIVGLMAALTFFGAAAVSAIPGIMALSKAMLVLGGAMFLAGAGILMFSIGVTALAGSLVASVGAIVAAIGVLIAGVIKIITDSAVDIAEAIKAVLLAAIDMIVEVAVPLAEGIVTLLVETLRILSENIGPVIDYVFDILITIIDRLAERIPELVVSLVNFFGALFGAFRDAVDAMDTEKFVEFIIGFNFLAILVAILATIAPMIPTAMIGVVGLTVLAGELALALAALGGLYEIPHIAELMEGGGNLLELIGQAIGKFIGGIIGGTAEAVTDSMPKIGENLSVFADNVQGFISMATGLDSRTLDGVKNLAEVILVLTAADLLDGITSFFSGGENNLVTFGQKIKEFGPYIAAFADSVKDINARAVEAAGNAALALAEMANNIPSSGGQLGEWFFGQKDMALFGTQILAFGTSMAAYAEAVEGINPDIITASTNAAQALVSLATDIPNSGGVVGWIMGNNDIDTFGIQLVAFGTSMAAYAETVKDIDPVIITASANAAQALVALSTDIPNSGGIVGWFMGDNDMATFGNQLVAFGSAMAVYCQTVSNVGVDNITAAVSATESIIKMMTDLSNGTITTTNLDGVSDALKRLGETGVSDFCYAFTYAESAVNESISAFVATFRTALELQIGGGESSPFYTAGQKTGNYFLNGIKNKATTEMGSSYPVATMLTKAILVGITLQNITGFYAKGILSGGYYIDGVSSKQTDATTAGGTLAQAAIEGLGSLSETFNTVGVSAGQGLVDGLNSMADQVRAAAAALANAANVGARSAQGLDVNSPSKKMIATGGSAGEGLVEGILSWAREVNEAGGRLGNSATIGVNNAINGIGQDISQIDPTITPIVDLSNVEAAAASISEMFNRSIDAVSVNAALASGAGTTKTSTVNNPEQEIQNGQSSTYNFVQNNYSPKSLSRLDIYRQTNNQFSRFKDAVQTA